MAPGRNDPCPCGSGRKFKHCHGGHYSALAGPPTQDDRALAFDRLDHAAGLSRFADDYDEAIDVIWPDLSDDDDLDEMLDSPAGTLFLEWLQFDFVLRSGHTMAEYVLDKDAASLTPGGRRFLRACTHAPLRLLQVIRTKPGAGVLLKDLIDRGPAFTVADYDGERQIEGIAISVNILDRIPLARAIRRNRRRLAAEPPPSSSLTQMDRETTGATLVRAVVEMIESGRPRLTTAEGDELEFLDVVFAVSDPSLVRAALDIASDLEAHEDDQSAQGGERRYAWFEASRADRGEFARILGTVGLRTTRLRVETMSMARARLAQDRFSKLAPGGLSFMAIEAGSVEGALDEPLPEKAPLDIDPEIARPIERDGRGFDASFLRAELGLRSRHAIAAATQLRAEIFRRADLSVSPALIASTDDSCYGRARGRRSESHSGGKSRAWAARAPRLPRAQRLPRTIGLGLRL